MTKIICHYLFYRRNLKLSGYEFYEYLQNNTIYPIHDFLNLFEISGSRGDQGIKGDMGLMGIPGRVGERGPLVKLPNYKLMCFLFIHLSITCIDYIIISF